MKLLFDENLSPKLVGLCAALFPGSPCVRGIRTFEADPTESVLVLG